jgi:HlyD family secretion protein
MRLATKKSLSKRKIIMKLHDFIAVIKFFFLWIKSEVCKRLKRFTKTVIAMVRKSPTFTKFEQSVTYAKIEENTKIAIVKIQKYTAITIIRMDIIIRFLTKPQYPSGNPAIDAVRLPLIIGLWVMITLGAVILIWGTLAPIESGALAKGSVALLSKKKSIQHLEGGIIKEILVNEGDKVIAGQQLILLSDTAASANVGILQWQLYIARANESRLIALRDNLSQLTFDNDMIESGKTDENLSNAMSVQTQLFNSALDTQKTKYSILDQRIAQSQEEIVGLEAQIKATASQIELGGEETATSQMLVKKGYDTKTHLFKLQRTQSELQGNLGQYSSEVAKTRQNIAEIQMQRINQQNEFETKNSQDLRDIQAQISNLNDKLREAKDVLERTVVTAPNDGIITALKYHTAGGVITPGAVIMDIIPQDDLLVIEAHIKPNDISVVHAGLNARVIFTSYKTRTTPKIPGKVTQVSADTFFDEHRAQDAPYYIARVEVDKSFIDKMKEPIELYPGMPADVLIRTGSRSFLSYLFQPITDSMNSSFREK